VKVHGPEVGNIFHGDCCTNDRIQCTGLVHYDLRITGSGVKARQRGWSGGIGRFTQQDVQATVEALLRVTSQENTPVSGSKVKAYMCGPSSFEEAMEAYICAAGVRPENIKKEQWW
jgi:hypothetical protein